jgi:transcriptional regulator with XRE-family HTH domain
MLHSVDTATMVRMWRAEAGLSQRALARRCGAFASTIRRIEDGSSDPTITMLERIAAASGRQLTIDSAAPTETSIAGLVARLGIDEYGDPDWTALRSFADWTDHHPEHALDSIASPPMRTGSDRIDNLIAAIAETIADAHGDEPPRWCSAVDPLEHPWLAPGTAAMRKRHEADIPQRFAQRNIRLPLGTVWRSGTLVNP